MNPREIIQACIDGKPHPRVPVAQHNFPFVVRWAGLTMKQYREDPVRAARALADCADEFGYDCIIIDFDTCSLAEAMGAEVTYPGNEPARILKHPLEDLERIGEFEIPDPKKDGRLPLWLETTRELRRIVGDSRAIMARADQGPFGLLFALRGHEECMIDVIEGDPELLDEALVKCTEAGVLFAQAQLEAGADLTSIGDSAAGESLISPKDFHRLAQPYEKRYKEALGNGCLSIHICGKTNNILEGMLETGADVLELDHWNDFVRSLEIADSRCSLWGNLDPSGVLSLGTPETVFEASRNVLEAGKRRTWRFALCPGCTVNADVPPENLRAMTQAALEWGCYDEEPNVAE